MTLSGLGQRCFRGLLIALCAAGVSRAGEQAVELGLRDRCLTVLKKGLAADDFWPSMHAAEALTQAGCGDLVLQALQGRLQAETNDQYRCGLARERIRAGDVSPADVFPAILSNKASNGRIHAAESLYKVRVHIPEFGSDDVVRSALDEGDPVLELMAAAALFRGGDKTVLARVRRHLTSSDPKHWRIAAWVLGRLGDETDLPGLRRLTGAEGDALSQSFVWNALAQLGAADALDQVKANLKSSDKAVRTYAAQTVGDCGATELVPLLVPLLADENPDTCLRAAQSILRLTPKASTP